MVEWSKNGDKIDFTWDRHKAAKRYLKIKNVNEDDTGVFVCKGINGFGSETVRIELIIIGELHLLDRIISERGEQIVQR
jgi:hypothetical protein